MTRWSLVLLTVCAFASALAEPPPISAFARRAAISTPALSPDGRYLLFATPIAGEQAVVTVDRHSDFRHRGVLRAGSMSEFDIDWCGWANDTRILCGYWGMLRAHVLHRESRLIAVNADGSDRKSFRYWSTSPADFYSGFAPIQDRVIDFKPGPDGKVLIQLATEWTPYVGVLELDVYTARARWHEAAQPPICEFSTDGIGNVRLGLGLKNARSISYVRLLGERTWREWATSDVVPRGPELQPVQIIRNTNTAYARGLLDGRDALWKVDLEQKSAPEIVFSRGDVDVGAPIFSRDRRLLGVRFDADRPGAHYLDKRAASLIDGVNRILPGAYNEIIDSSADGNTYLIRSSSDIDAGSYYVIDARTGSGELEMFGTSYPELEPARLGRMQTIEYRSTAGVLVSGYLTVPPGSEKVHKLPLIVMAHDGPDQRDSWQFDYLRHFLVSRGYAVLQANFRGSRGFGAEWLDAANGDWSGAPAADIRYAASWAVEQGIADPARICVLGRGFGGYLAQLAAARDSDRFRCAVSIGGISDLDDFIDEAQSAEEREIRRLRIGADRKMLEAASPLKIAGLSTLPVLLVHGTHDLEVSVSQTKRLAAALKRAGKPYELVIIDGAGHDLRSETDRTTLLAAIEIFLATHLQ
jgi:dipeptidyl aminopeptidase/acylaminoacyl peptidase